PEVVPVREAAGKHDRAHVGQLTVGMPDRDGLRSEPLEGERRVAVVIRARERDDADSRLRLGRAHASSTSSISYDSINGFASSCSHMRSSSARVCSRSPSSSSRRSEEHTSELQSLAYLV